MDAEEVLATLATSVDVVAVTDPDLNFVFASEGFRSVLGHDPAEVFATVVGQVASGGVAVTAPALYRVRRAACGRRIRDGRCAWRPRPT